MRWLIASDIHGSAHFTEILLKRIAEEGAEGVILLGDLLYHGPRNKLPEGHDPARCADLLNSIEPRVFAVRGNCEAEVDQWLIRFPVMAEYCLIECGGHLMYVTHGHQIRWDEPLPLAKGDIVLAGHTHVPSCEERGGLIYMNPGSVAMPKEDSPRSYMTCEDGHFLWKRLDDGSVYMERHIEAVSGGAI